MKQFNHETILKICYLLILLFTFYFLLFTSAAVAVEYILPYPSFMPGHKLYRIEQIWEKVQEYWSFGSLAKFKYYLRTADKYLVEAKTLFEYQQYLLATKALEKSNNYFQKTLSFLQKAQREGKNVVEKREILKEASVKHKEVLNILINTLPNEVDWQEEGKEVKKLEIEKLLKEAIITRDPEMNSG